MSTSLRQPTIPQEAKLGVVARLKLLQVGLLRNGRSLDLHDLHGEDQGSLRRNLRRHAAFAVGKLVRNSHLPLITFNLKMK